MQIISKQPTDKFIFSIFADLTQGIDSYYGWYTALPESFFSTQFRSDLVAIGIKDLLGDDQSKLSSGAAKFREMFSRNKSTKFVICTGLENIAPELATENSAVVHLGGDWLNEIEIYQNLAPVSKKHTANTHVISLNRNPRHHRTLAASYLQGLAVPVELTFLHQQTLSYESVLDAVPWDLGSLSQSQQQTLVAGYLRLAGNVRCQDDYDIYRNVGLVNTVANFENRLREKYQRSFVEVVAETTFVENGFNLTEKTMQAFLGFNFPIMLSSPGTVQFLRALGFDMFDDVVNHSYDLILDPALRVITALDNNSFLLHNRDSAKQKWQECLPRFATNWKIVQSGALAQWFESRARKEFADAVTLLTCREK